MVRMVARWRSASRAPNLGPRLVGLGCWSSPVLMALAWIAQATLGDRWWPATILLYGPRWFCGLPLGLLLPLALIGNRSGVRPLLIATLILIGPVMGFCLPWQGWVDRIRSGAPTGPVLRVVTCNTDGAQLDPFALRSLIDAVRPDVVTLQEWHDDHRSIAFEDESWFFRFDRKGMGLASRFPILEATPLHGTGLLHEGFLVRYTLDLPSGPMDLVNLHLETPRRGIEAVRYHRLDGLPTFYENIDRRQRSSGAARELILGGGVPDLVLGDFNTTADSPIFRSNWTFGRNAYSAVGFGFGYSKYTRWFGARIDHAICGPDWRPIRAVVGPDVGSDHRPLIVDLERRDPPPFANASPDVRASRPSSRPSGGGRPRSRRRARSPARFGST